jgi:hypothetical protein
MRAPSVRSAGGGVRPLAVGPSPCPVAPWQTAQWVAKSAAAGSRSGIWRGATRTS